MHYEKTLSSDTIYQGRIITVKHDTVELENGSQAKREVVEHNGGVAVLAVDEEEHVLLVRQFRYPYGKELLELPAGKLERGEDPDACGLRELEEETGYTAGEYRPFGHVYPTPGYVSEVLHLYLARDLRPVRQRLDPDEFLTVERIPFERALALCLSGEIRDAKTIVPILKYQLLYRQESDDSGLPFVQ